MIIAALVVYTLGLLVLFGYRSWLQFRQTGSTGFIGIRERPGSLGWWGGVLFVLAIVATVLALLLAATGLLTPAASLTHPVLGGLGLALALVGLVVTFLAQNAMGASWRIGVDADERTNLVTGGIFSWVRNPIFTAMTTALLGLPLLIPSWLSLTALPALVAAIEIQVRAVEEPYLARVHGSAFTDYTARTGRFLPGIGTEPIRE
ncbi:methyltransferase family protein [Acrocarpospora catenulata]|uniref:methyltransferase family protein n=1 Tax=Acrocarpospora catenulata TaxID=2836182 RepID=UPI001BDAAA00|nr:isoprenylcysteine carboxylmethyltransferase family protein [Acrocarpospora catenulata]